MSFSRAQIVTGYQMILEGLGIDWENNPHMKNTPERAAKAMVEELCVGLLTDAPQMTAFPLNGHSEMVISRGIPVRSLCAHHLLPFVGEATVAYIPCRKVLGLSKLSRAVEYMSRRPQVQEALTTSIADFVLKSIQPPLEIGEGAPSGWGVAVVIRSQHFCMALRGVNHSADVITSALRGEFNEPEVRAEFLSLAGVERWR